MKRILLGIIVMLTMVTLVRFGRAADDQLVKQLAKQEQTNTDDLQLTFRQFSSCQNMTQVLTDFLDTFPAQRPYPLLRGEVMMNKETLDTVTSDSSLPSKDMAHSQENTMVPSSSKEYSTTNLQKQNVDEPEIIKTNGKYLFYKNQQEKKIYIIKSPLNTNTSTIDINQAEVVNEITIPHSFQNTQLFVRNNHLVIIATRWNNFRHQAILERGNRTTVAIYDVSNPQTLKLLKFTDMDGYYQDARMIDGRLFVLSNIGVDRWYRQQHKNTKITNKNLTPSAIDVSLQGGISVKRRSPHCDAIDYLLPSKETIKQLNLQPQFTLISIVDVDTPTNATTTHVVLGTQGQIHMSANSLYLTQNIWTPINYRCPLGAMCIVPEFDQGTQTLIHKFAIHDTGIEYRATNLIKGSPLTQYSMDEDNQGNFRILTRKNWRDGTNFYVFDNHFQLKGMIDGIAPGEQFKASRYIGDKLYLVTFKQTDPLLVIDVADINQPTIIGKLIIPGFSTYLHPMGDIQDGKQYLIGLGYATNEKGRQQGLQVSLFEVNYHQKTTDSNGDCHQGDTCILKGKTGTEYISIQQIAVKAFGEQGSSSEAMNNPRMFVMNTNNVVTLPMILQQQIKNGERCNIYRDNNGVETETNCHPVIKQQTTFAGLKSIKFDKDNGISELHSIDYLPLYQKLYKSNNDYESIKSRAVRNSMMRVGYAGDALYMINNDFAHFIIPGKTKGKYLYFDTQLSKNNTDVNF